MRYLFCLTIIWFLTSCATGTLTDPKALQAIQKVKIYENLRPDQYMVLKKIEGLSCGKAWWNKSSQEEAIKFLKAEATTLDFEFDGIVNLSCQNLGWSWKYNCNNSFLCEGDVFKFTQVDHAGK